MSEPESGLTRICRRRLQIEGRETFFLWKLVALLAISGFSKLLTRRGIKESIPLLFRLDMSQAVDHLCHGGILAYVLRGMVSKRTYAI